MDNKYIWLFGENEGRTANNNSFYFWKEVVNIDDDIDKYLILQKTLSNKKVYNTLSEHEKKYVLWRNSIEHIKKYNDSDLLLVSLSYLDVVPTEMYGKKKKIKTKSPVIYLQHGTTAIKRLGYTGQSYHNKMFRFCIYNKLIKEKLIKENDFKEYQLYYSPYHMRYGELARRNDKYKNKSQILWFVTWREYFSNAAGVEKFKFFIKKVVGSEKLQKYLEETDSTLKLCVHQFFDEKVLKDVHEIIKTNRIIIQPQSKTDVMEELAASKLLITDYSSVGFDFTFLNKPVILYQPDLADYLTQRSLYCEIQELEENSVKNSYDLIDKIIKEDYGINEFFKKRTPEIIDYEYVKNNGHIIDMYKYFSNIQRNKITFIGYNFYGIGGTVKATKSLAEGLLEKGYMVELISLKKIKEKTTVPYGLNMKALYNPKSKSRKDNIEAKLYNKDKYFSYLNYDSNKKLLHPLCGYRLTELMKKIRSNTVISTRESIHPFLDDCTSDKTNNKIYFFHTANNIVDELFPGTMKELKKRRLSKAVFVSPDNKKAYKQESKYDHYEDSIVLGNALEQTSIINIDEISTVEKKERYRGIYLLRVSKDRENDINNLIEFGKHLRKNKVSNIVIDVYGTGDYVSEFMDLIEENRLNEYINYMGLTNNIKKEFKEHDVLVDFSINNSFGMTYIEAIMNGRKVFCMENQGSKTVMKGIPNTYITSFDKLVKDIENLPNISLEELQSNYKKIAEQYSKEAVATRFINYLEKNKKRKMH